VIGISDKKRTLEGINSCGDERINEFINAPKDCCRPMPRYQEEFVDITNENGDSDRLLLLHIEPSVDWVIRTSNDRTYLRIGDKSKEMLGEKLGSEAYAAVKNAREGTSYRKNGGPLVRVVGKEKAVEICEKGNGYRDDVITGI